MQRNIILYDKQDITRLGIKSVISGLKLETQISSVGNKNELLKQLSAYPRSIVIIDYTLSDLNSSDSLLNISARFQDSHWILFSDELSVGFIRKVVWGNESFSIILKTTGIPEIQSAIAEAYNNRAFTCSQIANLLSMSDKNSVKDKEVLTLTEKEILKEIALGKTAKEIASDRHTSIHTITTHRKNIYRKLEVNNSQEASRYALRLGIMDSSDYYI